MGYANGDGQITRATPQPERRSLKKEKAIQTTLQRGETLFFDGYSMNPTTQMAIFTVTTPERVDRKTGEVYVIDYTVDVVAGTCNCTMFQRAGVCKHLTGARKRVDEAQAAYNEALRLLTPVMPARETAPESYTVNGKQFTDHRQAEAYKRELDFA